MTADNKVGMKPTLDKEKLLDWLESNVWNCRDTQEKTGWNDAVWKLNGLVRGGTFDAAGSGPSSGDARVLDELEKWTHNQAAESYKAGAMQHGLIFERVNEEIRAKLSELRTTAKPAEDGQLLKAPKQARGSLGYGPLETKPETIERVRKILDEAIEGHHQPAEDVLREALEKIVAVDTRNRGYVWGDAERKRIAEEALAHAPKVAEGEKK